MNETKNWNSLYEKYPDLFQNRLKSPRESPMGFGVECNLGWYDIISSICWMISQHERNIDGNRKYLEKNDPEKLTSLPEYFPVKFDQIKEKYGGLRVYYSGGNDYIRGIVSMAEEYSYKVCEKCGNAGKVNKGGWITTLCDSCRNES